MVVTSTASKILGPRERKRHGLSQRKKETWSFPEDATLSAEVGWERVSSRMGDPRCTLGVGEFRGRSCALLIRMSLNLSELPLHFA